MEKPTAISTVQATISATDLRVQRLREWDQVTQTCPALSREETQQVLAELDRALERIDPRYLAIGLADTLALWREPTGGASTAKFYVEALEEFPAQIVTAALKHVRMNHQYPTAPSPADFRRAALEAVAPLRAAQVRARLALQRYRDHEAREDWWAKRKPVVVGEGTPQADPDNLRVIGPARSILRRAD